MKNSVKTPLQNRKGSAVIRLLKLTKPYLPLIILSIILSAVQITAVLFAPVFIGEAVDYIIGTNNVDFSQVLKYISYIGICAAIAIVSQYLVSLLTGAVSHLTVKRLRDISFRKLSVLPLKYIDSNSHGDIISRMTGDIDRISDGLIQGFTQLFSGAASIIGTLIFMVTINWMLAIAIVIVTPLSLFVAYFIAKGTHRTFGLQASTQGKLLGYSNEMLSGGKTVKLYRYEKTTLQNFDSINGNLKIHGQNAAFYSALINPSTRFVNNIVYGVACVLGILLVINGGTFSLFGGTAAALSVGGLSAFLSYANQYTKPFNEISGVIAEFQTALAGAERVFKLLDEDEITENNTKELVDVSGNVGIDNLEFYYNSDRPLIEGFSVDVKSGQRVAIVGPTGCGKTTLINLLMRFYDPVSGSISIDGCDILSVSHHNLRKNIGMVLQDTWLKTATVRENIAYGHPDATMDEVIAAAKSAYIHGFISRLPKGYDTVLDENGASISAGQKQLLCIARVMLKTPPILILDEATSNIDTRTESRIQKAFEKLMQDKTSFIVAHRLSTIKSSDMILVMNNGNIVEKGTHNELLDKGGFYHDLYNSQFES